VGRYITVTAAHRVKGDHLLLQPFGDNHLPFAHRFGLEAAVAVTGRLQLELPRTKFPDLSFLRLALPRALSPAKWTSISP